MKKIANFLFKDDFIKKSALFTLAAGTISLINYVYHPVLGNLLPVAQFGEVEVLYSFYNIFGIFLFAFTSVIIHLTANAEDESHRNKLLVAVGKFGLVASFAVAILLAAASPVLRESFHFASAKPFLILAAVFPVATFVFFGAAIFQGQKRVGPYAIGNGLVSALRLLIGVVLVLVGLRVLGVMAAFLVAQLLAAIYMYQVLRKKLNVHVTSSEGVTKGADIQKEIRYGIMVIVANLSVVFFSNGDILAVKYFFDPQTAGLYSGISTIANIIYFATTPLCAMLLASIKLKNSKKENTRIFLMGLAIASGLGLVSWLLFRSLHGIIIPTILGEKFADFSPYLRQVSLVMALCGVYNVTLMYFLALRKKFVFVPATSSALVLAVVVSLRHGSVDEIVQAFTAAIIVGLVVSGIKIIMEFFKQPEQAHGNS